MASLLVFVQLIYLLTAALLAIFVSTFGLLLIIYVLTRHKAPRLPQVGEEQLCSVTVQLPIYNEADVIERLIDACAQLDYPVGKLHVQILDDSTDHTRTVVARRLRYWRKRGVNFFSHVRRADRKGYKAGALAYGMSLIKTDCVAIFDADFVPPPDFLRRTMPHFVQNERLAMLQTRWQHLNRDSNWLTRAQALSIDSHFVIEQVARSRLHLPMSMNGTGGIWRVAAVEDAGGWSSATLTEDLDLSYRALLRGWDFLYLVDVSVPGELPAQVQAYKVQQARWATGSTECLIRHLRALVTAPHLSLFKKVMGMVHLAQYAVQPLFLLLFLLTPILLAGDMFENFADLRLLTLLSFIPVVMMIVAQVELYDNWPKSLLYFPVQLLATAAILLSNTRAVLAAFHKPDVEREFKRTPKFRLTSNHSRRWTRSRYALQADLVTFGELLLAVYAAVGVRLAMQNFPSMAPYMMSYVAAFVIFAGWNIYQSFQTSRGYIPRAPLPP